MLQNNTHPNGAARPEETSLVYRLLFAITGLLAGEAIIAVLVGGQPLAFYFEISVAIGWAFVGLPIVLPLPSSLVSQIPWPVVLVAGCCLGPLALAGIFVTIAAVQALLGPGPTRLSFNGLFTGTELLWPMASLVSTFSVITYCALVRGRCRRSAVHK
jgi:hypothetical protein